MGLDEGERKQLQEILKNDALKGKLQNIIATMQNNDVRQTGQGKQFNVQLNTRLNNEFGLQYINMLNDLLSLDKQEREQEIRDAAVAVGVDVSWLDPQGAEARPDTSGEYLSASQGQAMQISYENKRILQELYNKNPAQFINGCNLYNKWTENNQRQPRLNFFDVIHVALDIYKKEGNNQDKRNAVVQFLRSGEEYEKILQGLKDNAFQTREEGQEYMTCQKAAAGFTYIQEATAQQGTGISAENENLIAILGAMRGFNENSPGMKNLKKTCEQYPNYQDAINSILNARLSDANKALSTIAQEIDNACGQSQGRHY